MLFFFRRAHTESTKQWLSILESEKVPVLICLTFADKLFAELMGNNGDYDIGQVKLGVEKQLKVCVLFQQILENLGDMFLKKKIIPISSLANILIIVFTKSILQK